MKLLCVLVLATLLKHTGANCVAGTTTQPNCNECGGSCIELDGCSCGTDPSIVCLPDRCDVTPTYCCPRSLYWDDSRSCCSDTLTCSPPCFSDETCKLVTGNPTCVCNTTYYKKNTTNDLTKTVTCDQGAMVASVSKCLLNSLGYDTDSFQLKNHPEVACNVTYSDIINNQRVQSIQVKAKAGWCGNSVKIDASKVYYTNILHIDILKKDLITINPINLNFSCAYNLTMQTSLNAALNPIISTNILTAPDGSGSFSITMAAYKDASFSTAIQENEEVNVGSDIYLGIFSPDSDSNQFALRAVTCNAAPSRDNTDPNNVQLLSGGCAVSGDVQTVVEQNGDALEVRIKIGAFQFQNYLQVFIFCDVRLCDKNTENCTGCQSGRSSEPSSSQLVLPIDLSESINYSSTGSQSVVSSAALVGSLLMLLINKLF